MPYMCRKCADPAGQTGKGFTGSNQRNPAAGQDQKKQDTGGQQQGLAHKDWWQR